MSPQEAVSQARIFANYANLEIRKIWTAKGGYPNIAIQRKLVQLAKATAFLESVERSILPAIHSLEAQNSHEELVASLKEIHHSIPSATHLHEIVTSAIAKAEGRA